MRSGGGQRTCCPPARRPLAPAAPEWTSPPEAPRWTTARGARTAASDTEYPSHVALALRALRIGLYACAACLKSIAAAKSVLCYAVRCYAMPCCAVLCYVMRCYAMRWGVVRCDAMRPRLRQIHRLGPCGSGSGGVQSADLFHQLRLRESAASRQPPAVSRKLALASQPVSVLGR